MFGLFERRLDPFPETRSGVPPKGLREFISHFCRDAWPWLAAMTVTSALLGVGEVLLFGFMGQLVDMLGDAEPTTFLAENASTLTMMAAFALLVLPGLHFVWGLIAHQVMAGNLPMSARWRMHNYLLGQSTSFFSDEFAGRVATRVMQTALALREVVFKVLDTFVYLVIFFVTMIVLVGSNDILLAVPIIAWMAIYAGLVAWFVPRLTKVSEAQADERSAMTGRIVDSYTNITTVKLFSHAGREQDYARAAMKRFMGTVYHQMRLVTAFNTLVHLNNAISVIAVGALGIFLWTNGHVSAGAIAVALGLSLRIIGMSQWVMWEVTGLFENVGVVFDGMSMLTKHRDVENQVDAEPLAIQSGEISFDNVSFHYGKGSGVIEGLNLNIQPGEKVGLVGRSGAGKSTLVNLLLRFFDTEKGQVLIDGIDVSSVTQESLRSQIGMVTQDTSLLHRSIRENIAYGRPGATETDILAACHKARADTFVAELEDSHGARGLDAQVGERGVKLSGGQRQRIALARIFLKDAPILVLDEATSALDSEVEAAIQDHLFELMEGKTVIAIAHRLSTIAAMDRLIVLDEGQVVEEGTHAALIEKGGLYADLWSRQSGGFIGDTE